MKLLTIFYAVSLVAFSVLVTVGVIVPKRSFLAWVPAADKIGHFLLMGVMAFLLNASLAGREFRIGPFSLLLGSAIMLVIATADELSQFYLPLRSPSMADLACDFAGILCLGRLGARWRVGSHDCGTRN